MKIKIGKRNLNRLLSVGITPRYAKAILGHPCKPTGRKTEMTTQVEFDGKLIGRREPFVFSVPHLALEAA